jgi:rod shape-determining protein MreD
VTGIKGLIVAVLCLWVAGGCQQGVASRMAIAGAEPDFLLIVLSVLCLFGNRRTGTILGFFTGLIQGALAGVNLATYIVTRTIAGFCIGVLNTLEFETNPIVAFIVTAGTTIVAQLMLMFSAPPSAIPPFLLATIGSALYNGALAMPLHMLVAKLLDPPNR